jgi:hypothetical protein
VRQVHTLSSVKGYMTESFKLNLKYYGARAVCVVFIGTILFGLTFLGRFLVSKDREFYENRKNSTCPTLFSIARTPRDTFLIMRSEEMCTTYLLDSIK